MSFEDLSHIRLMIGTPCYGGLLTSKYMISFLDLQKRLFLHGIEPRIMLFENESLITRARNGIVANFMASDYTHLMFIDADIGFKPESILQMLKSNKGVVAGCYPQKATNPDKLMGVIKSGRKIETEEQISMGLLNYNYNFITGDPNKPDAVVHHSIENGLMKVKNAATGFMIIQRYVIEKLIKDRPMEKYINYSAFYNVIAGNEKYFYTFFDTMIDPTTKNYLSEDYAFCYKCQESGIDIWLDVTCPLVHHGSQSFGGNTFIKWLQLHYNVETNN
jgi:hypothetical protein